MAIDPVDLRLKFLKQAARALTVPSPAVSATLGASHNQLSTADDKDLNAPRKEWDAQRREICGACGNVMVPGWSCNISVEKRSAQRPNGDLKQSNAPEKHLISTCLRCDRKTIQKLQPRPPKHIQTKSKPRKLEGPHITESKELMAEDSKVAKSANATSKQRKKARKGGLQAMLDKNKTQPSQGALGLDIMDFMQ